MNNSRGLSLLSSTISSLSSSFSSHLVGGAINAQRSSLNIQQNNFTGNNASYGGAIYCLNCPNGNISYSLFTYNTAQYDGGAIYISNGKMKMDSNTLLFNSANNGGGIGGSTTDITMNNTIVNYNYAKSNGGGIHAYISYLYLSNITISHNVANSSGGGLNIDDNFSGQKLNVNTLEMVNNTARVDGGAIRMVRSSFAMSNLTCIGNNASTGTGGCLTMAPTYGYLNDSKIINNTAVRGGGLGANLQSSTLTSYVRVEIRGNKASNDGGGLYILGEALLEDLNITDNVAVNSAGGLFLSVASCILSFISISLSLFPSHPVI